MEDIFSKGVYSLGVEPVHIVARASPQTDSVRYHWRPSARTNERRESAIRFWMQVDDADPTPTREEVLEFFTDHIGGLVPQHQDALKADYLPLVYGGVSEDILTLICYADFDVAEYIVGSGGDTLTVAYDRVWQSRSYGLSLKDRTAGGAPGRPVATEGEYQACSEIWNGTR